MGLFDRFRGAGTQHPSTAPADAMSEDDQAIARYRYMLRTAPPETIEQAHAEAFARLTPGQRRQLLDELAREIPEAERPAAVRGGDGPEALARVATRAEIRQPGVIERVFGGLGAAPVGGPGFGSLFAGSFLASMAGTVLGSMMAQHFFESHHDAARLFDQPAHGGDFASRYGDIGEVGGAGDAGDIVSDFDDGGSFDV